ncbi:MAG: carboxypeptidase-like regulatory domain-containing protein, partial [Vicinamibacterales bacterium]|nr:carboxypeptidase-like regulatory domain-containing protein [Vicinamibacterales bacterium]
MSGATVQVGSRSQTTGANGQYRFGGLGAVTCVYNQQTQQCDYVPPVSYTVQGTLSHPQGTALSLGPQTVQLSPGQVLAAVDLVVEPTGTVTGVLLDAAGTPQGSRLVSLRNGSTNANSSFLRTAQTNASGQFTFTDVRLGSFTVASTDPSNNLEATLPVTVTQNQTTVVELRYVGNVTVTVLVTRTNGAPLGGMSVQVTGTGFSRPVVATNASGIATVTDVPAGRSATVAAFHPLQTSILRTTRAITTAPGLELTLALPAFGSVSGTVRRPNGALVGPGVRVDVFNGTGAPTFFYQTTTDANSRYATDVATQPVPANNVTVRAQRPEALSDGFTRPTLTFPDNPLTADAQALTVDVRTPAVAAVRFTVTENGSPVSGAGVFLVNSSGGEPASTSSVTNASGQVTLSEIVEGGYAYRVRRTNQRSSELLDVASVVVGPANDGGTVNVAVEVKRFTITVRGTIFQADGTTPLPNPQQVELLRAGDRRQLATVCVGGTACAAAGLAPGEFRFTTFDAVQAITNQGAGISTGAGVIVRVRSPFYPFESPVIEQLIVPTANGEFVANVTVPVRQVTVTGQVFAADDTTPLGLGVVNTDFVANTSTRISGTGRNVNADGTFVFESLFLPAEGARIKLWNVPGLANGQVFALTGPATSIGQTLPVRLTLPPSTYATVRGRVLAGDGATPLREVSVQLRYGTSVVEWLESGADGRFEQRVVLGADGALTVRVLHPDSSEFTELQRTASAQGETIDLGDITLPVSVLSGTVTYGGAAPVYYPSVFARREGGPTEFAQVTREDGTYVFYNLPAGDYTVTANDDNGLEGTTQASLASDVSVVSDADIELPALAALTIDVRDRAGQPAQYANVVVRAGADFERHLGWFAEWVSGGSFTLDVPLGTVSIEAEVLTCLDPDWSETCSGENATTTIEVQQPGEQSVTVDLSALGSIVLGDVSVNGGGPVTGPVEVSWLGSPHPSFLTPQRTQTLLRSPNGTWTLPALPAGPLR